MVGNVIMALGVLLGAAVIYNGWGVSKTATNDTPPPPPPIQVVQLAQPEPVYATTPAELKVDYAFNIESLEPIEVQYPEESKWHLYEPGKGCSQLPQPRWSGPKKFRAPGDDPNKVVRFRIYAAREPCK